MSFNISNYKLCSVAKPDLEESAIGQVVAEVKEQPIVPTDIAGTERGDLLVQILS